MGRAFEFRKARKFKRWGNMARVFTRLGREIEMAVKSAGADPSTNSKLRLLIQTARTENMPKDNVERAIKRAISKDTADYKEVVYEGYAPHGVALVIETATDNPTRTVANVRSYFNKLGGSLGTTGMCDFLFDRQCNFTVVPKEGIDLEELELELIDFGVEDCFLEEDEIKLYSGFVIRKTVLISLYNALFVCDNCISYSKSKDVLKPLNKTAALRFFAYSTVSP